MACVRAKCQELLCQRACDRCCFGRQDLEYSRKCGKAERINKRKEQPLTLLDVLQAQKPGSCSGGIYHRTQIDLTYNSNHIEGNRLTHDQTRYIFETNTIGMGNEVLNVDDVIETVNHFRCIDMIIDYRGLKEWDNEKGYLTDICLTAQDKYKAYLDYFRIAY